MIQSASAVLPRVAKSDIAYAGFWRRLLAYLIDGTLLAGVELALYSTVHVLAPDNLDAVANIVPVAVAIGWAYFAVLESSPARGTLGKVALGLYVADLHGDPITFGRAVFRNALKSVSWLVCGIGWVLAAVPPHSFLRAADLTGFSALVAIYKGQTVTGNVVASNPDQITPSSFLPIPQGYIALTLPTSEQQGVAGFIAQGDYIDVIATVNTQLFSPVSPRQVTRTVFTSVYILRVGPQSVVPRQGQAQGLSSSITVLMSLCDAQYMDWLLSNATLKYDLLSYRHYTKQQAPPDPACPSTAAPGIIGPAQVQGRWGF